jgi:hypothetical protein
MLAVAVPAPLRPTLLAVDSCTHQHANSLVPGQIVSGLVPSPFLFFYLSIVLISRAITTAFAAFCLEPDALDTGTFNFLSVQTLPRGSSRHRTLGTFGLTKSSVSRATPSSLGKDVLRAPLSLSTTNFPKQTKNGHTVGYAGWPPPQLAPPLPPPPDLEAAGGRGRERTRSRRSRLQPPM